VIETASAKLIVCENKFDPNKKRQKMKEEEKKYFSSKPQNL
jgi:hypothetical protein